MSEARFPLALFQSMATWPSGLWAYDGAEQHGGKHETGNYSADGVCKERETEEGAMIQDAIKGEASQ